MEIEDRLAIFRSTKSQIRGSEKFLVVGIDIAKDKHHAFFGTPTGKVIRRRMVFDNDKHGFDKLLSYSQDILDQNGLEEIVFGLEPTGSFHKPLAEYLIEMGQQVVYVSPVAVKTNRLSLNGRWDKNDTSDAANDADLVGQGKFLYYDFQEDRLRELTTLLRFRAWLQKQKIRIRTRVRNHIVALYFPELDKHFQSPRLALSVVRNHLDPRQIAKMDFFLFCGDVAPRVCSQRTSRRVEEIWVAARNSVGCRVPAAAQHEARQLVDGHTDLCKEMVEVEAKICRCAQSFPDYKRLLSIPGFGPLVSAMVLAAIGDPHRFRHPRQVLRLAGLDLCASRSGKTSRTAVPVISKQGKAGLRHMLVQAAQVSASSNTTIRRYYTQRLTGRELERGIRLKMKVKLAAKLLVVAWTLMKTKQTFDPKHFKT